MKAEEFFNKTYEPHFNQAQSTAEVMIKFAKLHVTKALEARDRLYQTHFNEINWTEENKKFISDSYPLENIK